MTILDVIELFENEMVNEISHSSADDSLKDELLESVKNVKQIVLDTYKAEKLPTT